MKVICLMIFLIMCNCSNKANENFEDIQKIKNGMTVKEVNNIMRNKPFNMEYSDDKARYYVLYESPYAASGHFYIEYTTKDDIVINTYKGD